MIRLKTRDLHGKALAVLVCALDDQQLASLTHRDAAQLPVFVRGPDAARAWDCTVHPQDDPRTSHQLPTDPQPLGGSEADREARSIKESHHQNRAAASR